MCQTILEENVSWLSNEHRKIRKSSSTSPDTICVVPYTSFCVDCLLLYQDWAKFVMNLMTPEFCSTHQYLDARWSTFSDAFHTFSFTMQSRYQNPPLSLSGYCLLGASGVQITRVGIPLALNREIKLHYIVMLFMLFVLICLWYVNVWLYYIFCSNVSRKLIFMPSFYSCMTMNL